MQRNISVLSTRQCTSSTQWLLTNLLLALGKFLRFSSHKFTTLISVTTLSCVASAYFLDSAPIHSPCNTLRCTELYIFYLK